MSAEATRAGRPDAEPHDAVERSACLRLIEGIHVRLSGIQVDEQDGIAVVCGDAFRLELRRIEAVIESVRQGLHRTNHKERVQHD